MGNAYRKFDREFYSWHIEIVDELKKIEEFIPAVEKIFEEANCGGLITIEKAEIIVYKSTKK